ncbi:hypothetical protein CAG69_16225 [Vibrio sp. V43_P6S15P86]|uniref:hypothetical protein n=1 Tax=Vibrio sp. V43_P6S15P86 TaxID=1938694 RepID=UPI001372F018|nr:hypothetical protein [Vibrio sp. V43_P6S15P86]NAW83575.1 hypothetical protein [Vibrio sp. V43_P6S15P86]
MAQKETRVNDGMSMIWAGGVYSKVCMDDNLCLLVVSGVYDTGPKKVLALVDGYRESDVS